MILYFTVLVNRADKRQVETDKYRYDYRNMKQNMILTMIDNKIILRY